MWIGVQLAATNIIRFSSLHTISGAVDALEVF
jgi:hypothetical protein